MMPGAARSLRKTRGRKIWDNEKILTPDSRQIRASILIKVIREEMRHILPIAGAGDFPNGGCDGARRYGECVFTIGFDQGLGEIDRQARISAPVERRAAAAARRAGPHHRFSDNDLRSAPACRCSSSAAKSCSTRGRRSRRWPTKWRSRSIVRPRSARQAGRTVRRRSSTRCRHGRRRRSARCPRRRRRRHDRRRLSERSAAASAGPFSTCSARCSRLTTFGAAAGTSRSRCPTAPPPSPRCARCEIRSASLAVVADRRPTRWRTGARRTALTVTLSATTGFVVLILGFAFHWQATRAREADLIHDTVRGRIDTALNRGRCGLWDWDLARGRVFWSHSMFDMLGLPAEGRSAHLRRAQRARSSGRHRPLRTRPATRRRQHAVDRPRLPHAPRRTAAGCGCGCAANWPARTAKPACTSSASPSTYPSRKAWSSRTTAADLRLRDAIETIPEAFVLWDADNRLVLCNSNFQELHHLPDEAVVAGTPYDAVVPPAGSRSCAPPSPTTTASRRARAPSKPSSTTAAGCTSANAAPRTAVTSRSAPTSPRSSSTSRSWSRAKSAASRPSTICAIRSRRWSARPASSPTSPKNTPRRRPAPRKPTRPSRNSSPT